MESKQPFGPWYIKDGSHVEEGKRIGCIDIIDQPDYGMNVKHMVQVNPYGGKYFPTHEEALAIAHLIAACPDMFEIIKEMYEYALYAEVKDARFPEIEAAYLKATGQHSL